MQRNLLATVSCALSVHKAVCTKQNGGNNASKINPAAVYVYILMDTDSCTIKINIMP